MAEHYEIRQEVHDVNKNWLVCLWETALEYKAKNEFERIKKEYPHEYFELVKVQHAEKCLDFTPKQAAQQITAPDQLQPPNSNQSETE